jgi:uncharacterized protein
MSTDYKEIIEKVNAAFTAGRIEAFLDLCTDDIGWTIVGDQTVVGHDAIREFIKDAGAMEAPTFTVDKIIVDGDSAVCCGGMRMNEKEECVGSYEFCDVYGFKGEKISELRTYLIKLDQTV